MDADADGLPNGWECQLGLDPTQDDFAARPGVVFAARASVHTAPALRHAIRSLSATP